MAEACPACGADLGACMPPVGGGLTITRITKETPMYTSDRRLYLTRDGRVVEDGDPEAHQLLVGAGGQITAEMARQYGLPEQKPQDAEPAAEEAAEPKAEAKPAGGKARAKAEDK